jgi:hypothetical protein
MTTKFADLVAEMRLPYALRRVSAASFKTLLPLPESPQAGDITLAQIESIGKNARLELAGGRLCTLHEGDLLAVVFGNRYATKQFEGYARRDGERSDLLSMGGMCGIVTSRHSTVSAPTRLRQLGALGDNDGNPLQLRAFSLNPISSAKRPRVIVVCGTAMDVGKTHSAASLIKGLRRKKFKVAGIKLTGTVAGRDTWSMLDAGACAALDFVDGGYPSTYLCSLSELLDLYRLLTAHAGARRADWVVVELADSILQKETAALLCSPLFTSTVEAWVLAASDSLAAAGALNQLRRWRIEPLAVSGLVSMSALGIRETAEATGLPCLSAKELQDGELNSLLSKAPSRTTNAQTGVADLSERRLQNQVAARI